MADRSILTSFSKKRKVLPDTFAQEGAMAETTFLDKKLDEAEIGSRLYHGLRNAGHVVFRTIVPLTDVEFLKYPNIGRKSLNELKGYLAEHGWPLGTGVPAAPVEGARPEYRKTPIYDEQFAEIQTLLQSARILCEKRGLGSDDNENAVSSVLDTAASYFPEGSAEHRALNALSHAAHLDLYTCKQGEFESADIAAAIDLLAELFVRRKVAEQ